MEFGTMRDMMMDHFAQMTKDVNHLFEVNVDKDEMWNTYLDSYPAGTNKMFRERQEYDCNACKRFVRAIGNAVVIKNGEITTIWDFRTNDDTYQPVLDAMSSYVRSHAVSDLYVSKLKNIGIHHNEECATSGKVITWDHLYIELSNNLVDRSFRSEGDIKGAFRDVRNVFKRSLDEISEDAILTIMELISSNTLYKGEEWKSVISTFYKYKVVYDKLTSEQAKELFAWEKSAEAGVVIGKIRNHSIGTLLVNLSEGMDLDAAVKKYEQIVAPSNYKRSKPIFTQKMLDDAKKTIEEMGYMDSLARRHATLDDITVNNILFFNKGAAKRISGAMDVFSEMSRDTKSSPKKFSKVEEIYADKFVSDVLPTASEVEVYLENRHAGNMVSLIAPENANSKSMFKWDNNFSWAYAGNVTDSMKERVKAAGGNVEGVLRFSIQWNEDGNDQSDVDAHCIEPTKNEIYFGNCRKPERSSSGGQLDVDIRYPRSNIAVENITWTSKKHMPIGTYKFFVHQFNARGSKGFRAEIEFDGNVYSFEYNNPMLTDEDVMVAEVILDKNGIFTIKEVLPSNMTSKEVWGLNTNQFVPVSAIMYSPNYWNQQDGIGHRHYFFMLKDCVNPEEPAGYYNEFLKNELDKHKRVFEALGNKMHVKNVDDQLSGLGFSATKRNDVVVKVKGSTERIMKVKF